MHNKTQLLVSQRDQCCAELFANNVLAAYKAYDLDGIELDWEYPGKQGAEGNNVDSKDTPNFLLLLIILRSILPPTARISAVVQTSTFWDTRGQPMTDRREPTAFSFVLFLKASADASPES
ncbi:hypothetical protein BYT27DRAFT_7252073 [Phlegmacium glaucopus]|nr:hypothetical protein BYT27DRAFT_7252073 [Phlegmacium glaucopus]